MNSYWVGVSPLWPLIEYNYNWSRNHFNACYFAFAIITFQYRTFALFTNEFLDVPVKISVQDCIGEKTVISPIDVKCVLRRLIYVLSHKRERVAKLILEFVLLCHETFISP